MHHSMINTFIHPNLRSYLQHIARLVFSTQAQHDRLFADSARYVFYFKAA